MRRAVLLIAVAVLGVGWWWARNGSGIREAHQAVVTSSAAAAQETRRSTGPERVDDGQEETSRQMLAGGRSAVVPSQDATRSSGPKKNAVARSAEAGETQERPVVPVRPALSSTGQSTAAAASGRPGNERPQGSDYQPETVRQGLDLQPQLGVRIRSGADMAFSFDPQAYRDGAMHLINEVGRPVVVTFYGSGCSELRVNGQPISEGRAYLVGAEAVVRGSQAVGVEVRKPTGAEGEPLPAGAG